VFHLAWGEFGALFTGDAPTQVENQLVARYGSDLQAEVLKVGHHGSRTSTGDSLLNALDAQLALVPVGRFNRYGHPDPGVMARLARHGVRTVRTDENGTVSVRVSATGTITLNWK
jgi:competence protein ComEC